MRGEHGCGAGGGPTVPGSSPHARGAQQYDTEALNALRIIPACAGSTLDRFELVEVG